MPEGNRQWFGENGIVMRAGCSIAILVVVGCVAAAVGWKVLIWGGLVHAS